SLRFRVQAAAPCSLWVVSLDGSGALSQLYPPSGPTPAALEVAGALPGGAEPDDRPGPQRVFAVCAPGPPPPSIVEPGASGIRGEEALRSARRLEGLAVGAAQASVLLEKGP